MNLKMKKFGFSLLVQLLCFQLAFAPSILQAQTTDGNSTAALDRELTELGNVFKNALEGYGEHAVKLEKEEEDIPPLKPEYLVSPYRRAKNVKSEVARLLYDSSVSVEDRRRILLSYAENVIAPVRDLDQHTNISAHQEFWIEFPSVLNEGDGDSYFRRQLDIGQYDREQIENIASVWEGAASRGEEGQLSEEQQSALSDQSPLNPLYLEAVSSGSEMRLRFSPREVIQRDIQALIKVPTVKNIVRASKWKTSQNILKEIFLASANNGENYAPIDIPISCQTRDNGSWPKTLNSIYSAKDGEDFIETTLFRGGFLPNTTTIDEEVREPNEDYYLYYQDKNPLTSSYHAPIPWERNQAVMQGLTGKSGKEFGEGLHPDFDDYSDFSLILQIKGWPESLQEQKYIPEAIQSMARMFPQYARTIYSMTPLVQGPYSQNQEQIIPALVQSMFLPSPEEKKSIQDGILNFLYPLADAIEAETEEEVEVSEYGLTPFLLQTMLDKEVVTIEDLFGSNLRATLGRAIKIPFPSLYGSPYWRGWAFKSLDDWGECALKSPETFKSLDDWGECALKSPETFNLVRTFHQVCRQFSKLPSLCQRDIRGDEQKARQFVQDVRHYIGELVLGDEYLPTRRLDTQAHQGNYQVLARLWNYLRDHTSGLPSASISEKDYLLEQMAAENPWAVLRLGYLIARQERPELKDALDRAFRPLKLHLPLVPHHGNRVLNTPEKAAYWEEERKKLWTQNNLLFQKDARGEQTYYQKFQKVVSQTFLTKKQVEDFLDQNPGVTLSDETRDELDALFEGDQGRISEFLYSLYQLRGDTAAQARRLRQFTQRQGFNAFVETNYDEINQKEELIEFRRQFYELDGDAEAQARLLRQFASQQEYETEALLQILFFDERPLNAKTNFLFVDSSAKQILLTGLLKEAAALKKDRLLVKLDQICQYSEEDFRELQTLFHATSTQHQNLGQSEERIQEVSAKLEEMIGTEEMGDWWYIGAMMTGAFATVLAGSICTAMSGGLCAPLMMAMPAIGLGTYGSQLILGKREGLRKWRANQNVKFVGSMEELGFADARKFPGSAPYLGLARH